MNITFKNFSKQALMAAVLSVSVMSASCTKEDNMNPNSPEMSAMSAESQGFQDQYIITLSENYANKGGTEDQRALLIESDAQKLFSDNGITGATLAKENIFSNLEAGFVVYL